MPNYPNWFLQVGADDTFARHLSHLAGTPARVLQIGAFTGDASVWLLDNILTHPDAHLVDVEPWTGSGEVEHDQFDWTVVELVYTLRMIGQRKVWAVRSTSAEFFANCDHDDLFDFIYVDGDHHALTVLHDGLQALDHLRPGGILAFDDYTWGRHLHVADRPAAAIDFILDVCAEGLDLLERGNQVWVRARA
jgi:predicted O-methyltransferase YrrM